MKRFFLAVLLLGCFMSNGQTVVDSILTKYQDIEVSSMVFQDSLFFKIRYPSVGKYQYFWLPKNGTHQEVDLKELDGEIIFAITKSTEAVTYYYLSKNAKKIELNFLKVQVDGSKIFSKESIKIDGRFIGSYLDETLHVLTFNKKDKFLLSDTELNDGGIVKENDFPLPINLSDYGRIAFITEENHLSPMKASSPVKIYNRRDELVITSDNPFIPDRESELTKNFFLSSIIRVDKKTGKSTTQTKFEKRRGYFRSYLWRETIIRLTYEDNNNGIELATFKLPEMEQQTIQHLAFNEIKDIVHDELQAYYYMNKEMKLLGSPFILIDSLNDKIVLTIGKFWINSSTPMFLPASAFGVAGALASLLVNIAIIELSERNGKMVQIYTYLEGNLKSDFKGLKNENFYRKNIDEFEIKKTRQEKFFRYKGYMRFNGKILCFYKEKNKKSQYLKILAF